MTPTLVILAAGLGNRFGGLKQMAPVGPHGETIIDYSIFDAVRTGFGQLVFVVRRDIEEPFRQTIGARFDTRIPVQYAFQELDHLPKGFSVPPGRQRPWGTGHAILAAADVVQGPFAVANADDFYGPNSFRLLAQHLQSGASDYAMVGFTLRQTLSEIGKVARAVCETNEDGYLQSVTEITGIEKDGTAAKYADQGGVVRGLDGGLIVSMNLWAFTPTLFTHLRGLFARFLAAHGQEQNAEFYLPTAVNALVGDGRERCKVLPTSDFWCGMTYLDDRPRVSENIRTLVAQGTYPLKLWS